MKNTIDDETYLIEGIYQDFACNVIFRLENDNEVVYIEEGQTILDALEKLSEKLGDEKYGDPDFWDLSEYEDAEDTEILNDIEIEQKP